jgi:acetyl-CoA acetyltransferase
VVTTEFFLSRPELTGVRWYSQAAEGMIAASISDAVHALAAGAATHVLVWRAMYVPQGGYGRVAVDQAPGDAQFSAPYGVAGPIQWHALAYRRYLERYGASRESMAALAVNSRRNANRNPHAVFANRTLSRDEYLAAPIMSDPLCLFDCDVPVTACVAVVLTTTERAADLPHPPAHVAAVGLQTAPKHVLNYTLQDHIGPAAGLVDRLWSTAGLGPKDMSAAELYDGFSPSTIYWLEAAGFCGRGEALDFIQDARIATDGELPVNTFGGSLSQGRLHGMGHIAEAVLQLGGRAGERQVADAAAVAVFDGSPMLRGGGMILTRDPT